MQMSLSVEEHSIACSGDSDFH